MDTLKIYVRTGCVGCEEAQKTATHIEQTYSHIVVEVIDMNQPNAIIPDIVFATPTYMLNDHIVSLGNPDITDIKSWLDE